MRRIFTLVVLGAFLFASGLVTAGDKPEAIGSEAAAAAPAKEKVVKVAKKAKKGKKGTPAPGEAK